MARVSTHLLEELVREAEVLSAIKADIPNSWKILEHEIGRARAAIVRAVDAPTSDPLPSLSLPQRQPFAAPPSPHPLSSPLPTASSAALSSLIQPIQSLPLSSPLPTSSSPQLASSTSAAVSAAAAVAAAAIAEAPTAARLPPSTPRHPVRNKRVKLRVPAEKYPDYNFVGRLLGPRGATLKRLERDTACRIMIRGKGSIRKDKEAEVRGKPGWEHVFHEPLHVVIEVVDGTDDATASRTLARAKELVEMLLVPVPEERDSLKRAQLRDLAILNGTHRSVSDLLGPALHPLSLAPSRSPPPPLTSSPPPLRRAMSQHAKPPNNSLYSTDPYGFDPVASFTRHASPPVYSSPAPSHRNVPTTTPLMSNPAASDSLLPDLEKLRLPTLEFDNLNEPNLSSPFPMPTPSPTIVDPEIYPYPPTPGLVSMDHQQSLGAFASPMWNPRPSTSSLNPSAPLPPRSPPVPSHPSQLASFLLGRPPTDNSSRNHPTHSLFHRENKNSASANQRDFSDHSLANHLSTFPGEDELSSLSQFAAGAPSSSMSRLPSPPPPRQATPSPPPPSASLNNQRSPFAGMPRSSSDGISLSSLFPHASSNALPQLNEHELSLRFQPPPSPAPPLDQGQGQGLPQMQQTEATTSQSQ